MLAVVPSLTVPWSFFSRSSSPEPSTAPAALSPKLSAELEQVQKEQQQQQESFEDASDHSSLSVEQKSVLKKVNKTRQPRRRSKRLRQSVISSVAASKSSLTKTSAQQKKTKTSGSLQHSPLKTRRQSTWLDRLCMAARWKMGSWQTAAKPQPADPPSNGRRSTEFKSTAKINRSGRRIDSEDSHDSMSSEEHHPLDVVSHGRRFSRKRRGSALDDDSEVYTRSTDRSVFRSAGSRQTSLSLPALISQKNGDEEEEEDDDVFLLDQKTALGRSGSSQRAVRSASSCRRLRPRQRSMDTTDATLKRRRQAPRRASSSASRRLALDDSDSGNDAENDEFWNSSAMSLKKRDGCAAFKRSFISSMQMDDEEEDRFVLTPAAYDDTEEDVVDTIVDVERLTTDDERDVEDQEKQESVVEQTLAAVGLVAAPGEIPTPMFHEVQLPWHKDGFVSGRKSLGRRCRSAEDQDLLGKRSSVADRSNKKRRRRHSATSSATDLDSVVFSNHETTDFEIIDDEVYGKRHRPLELIEKRTRSRELEMMRYEEHLNKLKRESPQLWL